MTKISSSQERLDYQEEELSSKQENYDLVYIRYQHGIDSMLTVLKADEDFLRSRLKQIHLACDKTQATIELIRALGGGYHDTKAEKEIKNL